MTRPTCLSARNVGRIYKTGSTARKIFSFLNFDLEHGEILAIVGRSGCGKTSLLDILAGFSPPDSGQIFLNQKQVKKPGPAQGVVFQEDALFPWLTVIQNVIFGLRLQGLSLEQCTQKSFACLKMVGLENFADFYPDQLSGGMKQRVALARVIALEPIVMLMDEPFAALDAQTREEMQDLLLDLHKKLKPTIVFVTHDVAEAVKLADRVLVLGTNGLGIILDLIVSGPRPRDLDSKIYVQARRKLRASLMNSQL